MLGNAVFHKMELEMRTTDTKERLIKAALEFIAPVSLLIQLCDRAPDKEDEVMTTIEEHIDIFIERWINT